MVLVMPRSLLHLRVCGCGSCRLTCLPNPPSSSRLKPQLRPPAALCIIQLQPHWNRWSYRIPLAWDFQTLVKGAVRVKIANVAPLMELAVPGVSRPPHCLKCVFFFFSWIYSSLPESKKNENLKMKFNCP